MEVFPSELKETPLPLVIFLGSSELCSILSSVSHEINQLHENRMKWLNFPLDHSFPPLKIQKEHISPQGIFKSSWMHKHHTLLPAVVVPVFEFDPRLSVHDWSIQEANIGNEVDRLRQRLSSHRECRIVLLLLQMFDMEEYAKQGEERQSILRKRIELDSKSIFIVKHHELTHTAAVMTKLEYICRTQALEYYHVQSKCVKRNGAKISVASQSGVVSPILQTRRSFKIGHYYEFRGLVQKMLKHYAIAYKTLISLDIHSLNEQHKTNIQLKEIKTIAEYLNFKICLYNLCSFPNAGPHHFKIAIEQFQHHIQQFSHQVVQDCPLDLAYEHWHWMSRQYQVFGQLIERKNGANVFGGRGSSSSGTGHLSGRYYEPYHYYSLAAKYASYRRKAAVKAGIIAAIALPSDESPSSAAENSSTHNYSVQSSVYWGGEELVNESNAMTRIDKGNTITAYREDQERKVDHTKQTMDLLQTSYEYLATSLCTSTLSFSRFRNQLMYQMGCEYLSAGKFTEARGELEKTKYVYSNERWWGLVAQVLRQLILCARYQLDTEGQVEFSLQLLSPKLLSEVSLDERKELQASVFHIWAHGNNFPKQTLNECDRLKPLFFCGTTFLKSTATIREKIALRIRIESYFPLQIEMSKCELVFNDARYNHLICHRPGVHALVENRYLDLTFASQVSKVFEWTLTVQDHHDHHASKKPSKTQVLRCVQIRLSVTQDKELTFVTRVDPFHSRARRNSVITRDGLVPSMGRGSGSPSFARHSFFGPDDCSDNPHMSERVEIENEPGSVLRILRPQSRARLEICADQSLLLAGNIRPLRFNLFSNEDSISQGKISCRAVLQNAPPAMNIVEDFFYSFDRVYRPLIPESKDELDPNDDDDDGTVRITRPDFCPTLSPLSMGTFDLMVKCSQARAILVFVTVEYINGHGTRVKLESCFPLSCHLPFKIASCDVVSTLNDSSCESPVLELPLHQASIVRCVLSCMSKEPLEIHAIRISRAPDVPHVVRGEFAKISNRSNVLTLFQHDRYHVQFHVRPEVLDSALISSLGQLEIEWTRLDSGSSLLPTTLTCLDLPEFNVTRVEYDIQVCAPAKGTFGRPFRMTVCIRNHSSIQEQFKVSLSKSDQVLVDGSIQFVEFVQPRDEIHRTFDCIPVSHGPLALPSIDVLAVRQNRKVLAIEGQCQPIYIFPRPTSDPASDPAI